MRAAARVPSGSARTRTCPSSAGATSVAGRA
jgi:hypothetical protein